MSQPPFCGILGPPAGLAMIIWSTLRMVTAASVANLMAHHLLLRWSNTYSSEDGWMSPFLDNYDKKKILLWHQWCAVSRSSTWGVWRALRWHWDLHSRPRYVEWFQMIERTTWTSTNLVSWFCWLLLQVFGIITHYEWKTKYNLGCSSSVDKPPISDGGSEHINCIINGSLHIIKLVGGGTS